MTAIAAGLNQKELAMIKRNIDNLKATAPIVPQVNGLDPSLKRAALSLAHRSSNEYATKSGFFEKAPRRMPNDRKVSDSKPGTFWTLKYKNRWFSDGAFVSGNPVVSSFLINEINRGSDLREVENWVGKNTEIILELTSSVFASQAPHWTDIFPYKPLSLASAQRGETVFNQSCAQCHGVYEKFWSDPNSPDYSAVKILKTKRVVYPNQTQVLDVGTDSGRYTGLSTLMPLNTLHMAKTHNIKIEVQRGYVPPPLDGIFARYPYLHNNSVPSLCALLSPAKSRPKTFVQGPSYDPRSDFDDECIGYPVGNKIPPSWLKIKDAKFDTRKEGLSNIGHEAMLFDESGAERFSAQNKSDLIEFLKTL